MPLDPQLLLSAFLLGFLGSAHCFGMCGGLASAFGLSQSRHHESASIKRLLSYNLGRMSSYCLAGLIVGLAGFWLSQTLSATSALRYFAGIMLVLMGITITGWFNGIAWTEKTGQRLWRSIQPLSKRFLPVDTPGKAFAIGMVWGWLPCGLVYSALIWAGGQGHWISSTLIMLCFGLGTLPSMMATGFFASQLSQLIRARWFRTVSGSLLILFGIWSLPWVQSQFMQWMH